MRAARPEDAEAIATVITTALAGKFRPAFGRHARAAMTAVVRGDLERPQPAYWVAVAGDRVVGAVHLSCDPMPDPGYLARVAGTIGWIRAARALAVLTLLAHGRIAPDEAYVEELAVATEARRRGGGRALLAACEREAARRGRTRLTLWVTSDNAAALALYAAAGFSVVRRERWLVGRLLFRSPGAVFMAKPVPRPA